MAPPPQRTYDHSYYDRPQPIPLFAPPYSSVPMQGAHGSGVPPSYQQPGQWSSHMPPTSFSPPQTTPYAAPSFMPAAHSQAPAQMPNAAAYSHIISAPHHIVRPPASLQPGPGLPARPSFDPPSFNREDMQRMHTGQAPPPATIAGHPRPAAKPRKLTAHEQVMEDVDKIFKEVNNAKKLLEDSENTEKMRKDAKDGLEADQALAAAKAAQEAANEAANPASDAQTGPPNAAQEATNEAVNSASDAQAGPANATQEAEQQATNATADAQAGPANAPAPPAAPSNGSRQRRPFSLVYNYHDESPEQKMAKRSKYTFERNDA